MPKEKKDIDWEDYESLIHKIYTELEPTMEVRKNDYIMGRDSKTKRQIDISIRHTIAGHQILMIIQAKKLKRPADINVVGEFSAVIRDVQASKGILICHSGFTKSAKITAAELKIDLCSAHDASKLDWQKEIQIPVIKNSIKVDIKIKHSFIPMGEIGVNGLEIPFPEDSFKAFMSAWENDDIPKAPGEHIFEFKPESLDFSKTNITLKSIIEYKVSHRFHFKFFIPIDYRGLQDYLSETFRPSFMAFKEKIPYLDDGTWKYIKDPTEISISSVYLDIEIMDIGFLKKKLFRIAWKDATEIN
ncbi:hypothetical protein ASU31_25130 [Pedobacter ginsenosidimutans]|uniref:Restriction endonuclease type IV Mrr domain-containing protein n=1 Tax=Pedobacter ginsenosidimutans TaxID=687842 RepID=A0A0T5VHE9_9SPHI|nr:restriction endonuclease [Pedobacter ginsenosidimutans]KRT13298.1 hypothetical protein ASU31_25130 [Pedobacter ginsenosidimutans]